MLTAEKLLLWSMLLRLFVTVTSQCDCSPIHPQKAFCDHDFTLQVTILKPLKVDRAKDQGGFAVSINYVFRGNIRELNFMHVEVGLKKLVNVIDLLIPPSCSMYNMRAGETWLIFAENMIGKLYTDTCYGNRLWSGVSKVIQYGVNGLYEPGCSCSYELTRLTEYDQCTFEYSFMGAVNDNCVWKHTRDMQECVINKYKLPVYYHYSRK